MSQCVCPACGTDCETPSRCHSCGFPLQLATRCGIQLDQTFSSPPPRLRPNLQSHAGTPTLLISEKPLWIGRGRSDDAEEAIADEDSPRDVTVVRHRELEPQHVVVLRDAPSTSEDERTSAWLIDHHPSLGKLYVDGRATVASRLEDGQVVQLGPLGWQYHERKSLLVPVEPIVGFDLAVHSEVAGRLARTELEFAAGEMTAVVGPSGCGKSTLLETIRDGSGLDGFLDKGLDATGLVYFVPQRDLVHEDLRLGDALSATARIYGREVLPYKIDEALDSVGLPLDAKRKFPRELSGGQLRRFRLAGALLSGAGVIVLDEPDSGLDHETADEIIALLRSLAIRGATVIAVTHHRHVLDSFDRVVELRPGEQGGEVARDRRVLETEGAITHSETEDAKALPTSQSKVSIASRMSTLLWRECQKLVSPRLASFSMGPIQIPSCLVSWGLIPLLFAAAVAISVPTDAALDPADGLYGEMSPMIRVGFLSLICVIWMSASASHLSLTRERELLEYERSHGVTWGYVLGVKSLVLCGSAILQTGVFLSLLSVLRSVFLERSFFILPDTTSWLMLAACFLVVSMTATMLGLLVSAIAGRSPLLAAASLPVILMVQILFSAPFAVSNPDGYEPLADYERLTWNTDEETEGEVGDGAEDWDEDGWEDDGWEMVDSGDAKPMPVTSLISYGTISRYGDQWIRSFAVSVEEVDEARKTQWTSVTVLAGMSLLSFCAAWIVLQLQTTPLSRRLLRRSRVTSRAAAFVLMTAAVGFGTCSAEPPAEPSVVTIPLVDGRYDENRLRAALGLSSEEDPRWREFDQQDRVGLVTLELLGKLKFDITPTELRLEIASGQRWNMLRQLAPPRLLGVENAGGERDVIVFVHGLEGGAATFASAAEQLEELGISSMRFDFPNDGPPDEIGEMLSEQLTAFHEDSPKTRIHLVAHSLGGLVSTWAVTEPEFGTSGVVNVLTLGTPFAGSALAKFHVELELLDVVLRTASLDLSGLDTISDGQGEAAEALEPSSDFLRRLSSRRADSGIRFHLAAGTKSFLPAGRLEELKTVLPKELARMEIGDTYSKSLTKLISAQELRMGQGDGAVTIESALAWSPRASERRFELTHTELVASPEPLEWVLETTKLGEGQKVGPK
ncbi:MAG: AAA family ATPase [Planctomycetota bacterium]